MKMPGNAQRVFNVYAVHKYVHNPLGPGCEPVDRPSCQSTSSLPVREWVVAIGDVVESGFVSLRDS